MLTNLKLVAEVGCETDLVQELSLEAYKVSCYDFDENY